MAFLPVHLTRLRYGINSQTRLSSPSDIMPGCVCGGRNFLRVRSPFEYLVFCFIHDFFILRRGVKVKIEKGGGGAGRTSTFSVFSRIYCAAFFRPWSARKGYYIIFHISFWARGAFPANFLFFLLRCMHGGICAYLCVSVSFRLAEI